MVMQYNFFKSGEMCVNTPTKEGSTRTSESVAVTIVIQIMVGRMVQMVEEDKKSSILVCVTYALCIGFQVKRLPSSARKYMTRTRIVTEAEPML
jgi:hypothetical protein